MDNNAKTVDELLIDAINNGDLDVAEVAEKSGNGKFVGGMAVGVAACALIGLAFKKGKEFLAKRKAAKDADAEIEETEETDEE